MSESVIPQSVMAGLEFQPYDWEMEIKSGMVLKLKSGEIALVGDVNELLGVCDDCTGFFKEDIAEFAHLWEER